MLIRTTTTDNSVSSVEIDGQVFLPERKLTQQLNLRNDIRTLAELSARVLQYTELADTCAMEQTTSHTGAPSGPPKQSEDELVHHPAHYNTHPSGIECIYLTWGAGFVIGNAIKYLYRNQHKQSRLKDLKKALWYVEYARNNLAAEQVDQYFEFCPFISERSRAARQADFTYRVARLLSRAIASAKGSFSTAAMAWADGRIYRTDPSVPTQYTAELRFKANELGLPPELLEEFRMLKLPDAKNRNLSLAKFILMSEWTMEDRAILFLGTVAPNNNRLQAAAYYIKSLIFEEENK